MKRLLAVSIIYILSSHLSVAQSYRVYFKDKGIAQNVSNVSVALSPVALQKRELRNISLDQGDLPVCRNYVKKLKEMGAEVKMTSRWFNYALIEGIELSNVAALDFVKRIEAPKEYYLDLASVDNCEGTQSFVYGKSQSQIEMVRGQKLHDLGFLGDGMTIAVLDGGFRGADTASAFDSLWMNNRILGTYNFRGGNTDVYNGGIHGAQVLSILGGFVDSQLVGSAPHASYWLLKSEYEQTETPVEMDYWMEAAEFADSVGADIITSSLGYNQFDGGNGDFQYSDMDGNTTIVTRAADMAAKKGILVIVSAGNEGSGPWQFITAPADGDSVLAIGAVDENRIRASFSSIGPSADGRIKPDLMAQGSGTAYASGGRVFQGNGTSFSCPVVSGLAACLWQVNPTLSNMEIYDNMIASADRSFAPRNTYGFGIPNFEHAAYTISLDEELENLDVKIYPVPVQDQLFVELGGLMYSHDITFSIFDLTAQEILNTKAEINGNRIILDFPFSEGVYILKMNIGGKEYTYKIVK